MAIMMPEADQAVLARRDQIVAALRAIVPGEGVIDSAAEMLPYESDGLMAYRQPPMVVVLPETTAQVAKVLKYCHEQGIKVVPRGSGTSLSGGALPLADGVLLDADDALEDCIPDRPPAPCSRLDVVAPPLADPAALVLKDSRSATDVVVPSEPGAAWLSVLSVDEELAPPNMSVSTFASWRASP